MKAFARLLDQLAFTPARNAKLTLLRDYLFHAPDPERGWALASLTGALRRWSGAGQISATVSARSPTKSCDRANNKGSIRASAALRMKPGLAASKVSAPVKEASAQPRSGSGAWER